jgi:hypothetical protein
VQVALEVDEHGLAGLDVADDLEAAVLQHQRLGRDDPLVAAGGVLARRVPRMRGRMPNGSRNASTVPGDQRDGRVRAFDALVHARDRLEHLRRVELETGWMPAARWRAR